MDSAQQVELKKKKNPEEPTLKNTTERKLKQINQIIKRHQRKKEIKAKSYLTSHNQSYTIK